MTLPGSALAGVLLFAEGYFNGPLWLMCLALFMYTLTLGIIAPNAAACALAYQKKSAGSASALMGTIQFSVSAVASTMVSHFHDGTVRPMTYVIFTCAALALILYRLLVKNQGT